MVNVIDGTNGFASQESPVAVVALANALLDISTTVKDDTLVSIYFFCYTNGVSKVKFNCIKLNRSTSTAFHLMVRLK